MHSLSSTLCIWRTAIAAAKAEVEAMKERACSLEQFGSCSTTTAPRHKTPSDNLLQLLIGRHYDVGCNEINYAMRLGVE